LEGFDLYKKVIQRFKEFYSKNDRLVNKYFIE